MRSGTGCNSGNCRRASSWRSRKSWEKRRSTPAPDTTSATVVAAYPFAATASAIDASMRPRCDASTTSRSSPCGPRGRGRGEKACSIVINKRVRGSVSSVQRMPNVFDPDFDAEQDEAPFTWRRARLGRQAGAEALGASLFELPPGASSFPLHVHHANEEMIVVLSGRPTLRAIDSQRELSPGELVAC